MPLTPNFQVSQLLGTPNIVKITDTSTGSDVTITKRRVLVQTYTGAYLVPTGTITDYIDWALVDTYINLDILKKSQAVNITVQWLNVSDAIVESKSGLSCLNGFLLSELDRLTGIQAANNSYTQDNDWYNKKEQLWLHTKDAENAILVFQDISKGQSCLDRGTYILENKKNFF